MHADMLQRMGERLLKHAEELRRNAQGLMERESRSSAPTRSGRARKNVIGGGENEGELF